MFWGFSEGIDLCNEFNKNIEGNVSELNILLYGSGDPRSILKTIAKSYLHNIKINFYVIDGCVEIIARNLLLLSIALENPNLISLKTKTHLYMDIYGNSLIRPSSLNYITSKTNFLKNIVTDEKKLAEFAPIFNFDYLKYRERDGLHETFSFWLPKPGNIFDIKKYWEEMLRNILGARYDYRKGAYDWDLKMRLNYRGANQICSQEYNSFRETGVAFPFPEYEQSLPNKTLVAGLVRNGTKFIHRKYLGDTVIGPYCAFGLNAENPKLLVQHHGVNMYRATDLTERNLMEIFYEIQERSPYTEDLDIIHKLGCVSIDMGNSITSETMQQVNVREYNKPLISTSNVRVYFLSIDDAITIEDNKKFTNFFDVVFIAKNYFSLLKNKFRHIFKNQCLILFETKQYSVIKNEEIESFLAKIKSFAKELNLESITKFNLNINYSVVKYKNCT